MSHTAQLGGGEIALLRLLEGIDANAFEVRVMVFEDGPLVARLCQLGITTEVVSLGRLNDMTRTALTATSSLQTAAGVLVFAPRLITALRRHRPDLLVANTMKAALFLGLVTPLVGRRWIWHLHDRLASDYLPKRTARALRALARYSARHVVVNSIATRTTLGRISPSHVSVAYPGLQHSAFTGRATRSRERVIGMVGRVSATKGQLQFVEAAGAVLDRHPDVRFRIVGHALFQDGDYEAAVSALVDSSGLASRVELAGWSDDPTAEMECLQIFVHASPVPEPFGQVVIEAMARGVPVIATAAGGILEILDPDQEATEICDGVSRSKLGILVRPGDSPALARAILWALDHPDELPAMADRALASARERFTLDDARSTVQGAWRSALPPRHGA